MKSVGACCSRMCVRACAHDWHSRAVNHCGVLCSAVQCIDNKFQCKTKTTIISNHQRETRPDQIKSHPPPSSHSPSVAPLRPSLLSRLPARFLPRIFEHSIRRWELQRHRVVFEDSQCRCKCETMNQEALSFTLTQINHLVSNLNKKNFEPNSRQIEAVNIFSIFFSTFSVWELVLLFSLCHAEIWCVDSSFIQTTIWFTVVEWANNALCLSIRSLKVHRVSQLLQIVFFCGVCNWECVLLLLQCRFFHCGAINLFSEILMHKSVGNRVVIVVVVVFHRNGMIYWVWRARTRVNTTAACCCLLLPVSCNECKMEWAEILSGFWVEPSVVRNWNLTSVWLT